MRKLLLSLVAIVFAAGLHAKEVTLLMDWFPQGNQSGFWQAQFDNKYHDDVKNQNQVRWPKGQYYQCSCIWTGRVWTSSLR